MANTSEGKKERSTQRRSRGRHRARSRGRARARRAPGRRVQAEFRAARAELGQARNDVRRAGTNVLHAGERVLQAGEASMAAAREVAGAAGERVGKVANHATRRVGEAAEMARERVGEVAIDAGRAAVEVGAQLLNLPELVREGARRSVELVETAGARAVVSMIHAGTRVLSVAADYVSEITPRRRVQRQALEQLVLEQLTWALQGTQVYDRTVDETEDTQMRLQLVRFKLQTIKQAEALTELLREIGGTLPAEDEEASPSAAQGRTGRRARGLAARQGLAHALTIAVQSAEGWRALNRIAAWAEQDRVANAIVRASDSVGGEPTE
ncbi:MAG TPA: hypothetical protein VEM57_04530, partial [Candidatus Binatus sp.]|nr:hypothetical protein [Candidatus Binatus sp.]